MRQGRENERRHRHVPENYPGWDLRNARYTGLLLNPNGHAIIHELVQRYSQERTGEIFRLNAPTGNTFIVGRETAFQDALDTFPRHNLHQSLRPILGENGLFVMETTEEYMLLKNAVKQYFGAKTVRGEYFDDMWNFISTRTGKWFNESTGEYRNTEPFGTLLAVGSMFQSVVPLGATDESIPDRATYFNDGEIFTAFESATKVLPVLGRLLYPGGAPKFSEDQQKYEQEVVEALLGALSSTQDGYLPGSYLEQMAQAIRPEALRMLTEEQQASLKAETAKQVLSILIAGEVTTRIAIQSLMVFLGSNPDIWHQILNQVSRAFPDPHTVELDHTKLRQIPLIPQVVDYVGQQAPPLANIVRGSGPTGTQFGEHFIPPNSTVYVPVYGFYHQNGQQFEADGKYRGSKMFGSGERVCLGASIATTELQLVVLALALESLKRGRVELVSASPDPTLDHLKSGFSGLHPADSRIALAKPEMYRNGFVAPDFYDTAIEKILLR